MLQIQAKTQSKNAEGGFVYVSELKMERMLDQHCFADILCENSLFSS